MTDRVHPAIWFENLVAYQLKDPPRGTEEEIRFRFAFQDAINGLAVIRVYGSEEQQEYAHHWEHMLDGVGIHEHKWHHIAGKIYGMAATVKSPYEWHTDEAVRAHLEESFEED